MSEYAIETAGLTKAYGSKSAPKRVLSGLDLQVRRGQLFALLGPNGAGKTTLINILSTLLRPDSGSARVAGFDLLTQRGQVRTSISLTGQYAAVDEALSGRENLIMMSRLVGLDRAAARSRSSQLLEQFDLVDAADTRIEKYSGGMRRRIDLAVGLITVPSVVFLDEPTTGLDTRSRQELWEVITGLTASGVTILLTTQYLEEADHLADRIGVLNHGVLVAKGTPAELKATVGADVLELRDDQNEFVSEIGTDGTAAGLNAVLDGLPADQRGLRAVVRKPSLDDVFLHLTSDTAPRGGAPESDTDVITEGAVA